MQQTDAIVTDPPVRLARAASELGVSAWIVRQWCHSGRVGHYRLRNLIMMPESEIQRLLRDSSIKAKEAHLTPSASILGGVS